MSSLSSSPTPDSPSPAPATATIDEMIARLQTSLTVKELWKTASRVGMNAEQFERLSGVSPHRLRRGRGGDDLVDPAVNEPFLRCAKLFQRVVKLCNGDEAAARTWLNASAPVLKNRKPIEAAESAAGAKSVSALVTQLQKAAGLA